jgi:hypothetical protein
LVYLNRINTASSEFSLRPLCIAWGNKP